MYHEDTVGFGNLHVLGTVFQYAIRRSMHMTDIQLSEVDTQWKQCN